MAITTQEAAGAREWIARPNCSLTPAVRRGVIGCVLAISLLVTTGFVLAGAWMVLPFSGLELAALLFALRAIRRADQSYESVRLENGQLIVSSHLPHLNLEQRFPAGWARVSLESDGDGDALLCIRAHGRSSHIGRLMTGAERQRLVAELRTHLNPRVNTSPSGPAAY